MKERQELYCHECGGYVQFNLDTEINGNHILKCPKCGHEHCRVVKDGKITGVRWDSKNNSRINIPPTYTNWSTQSTYDTTSSTSTFLYNSWMNSSTAINVTTA